MLAGRIVSYLRKARCEMPEEFGASIGGESRGVGVGWKSCRFRSRKCESLP